MLSKNETRPRSNSAILNVLAEPASVVLSREFVAAFCSYHRVPRAAQDRLVRAAEALMTMVVESKIRVASPENIEVALKKSSEGIEVVITNHGYPIYGYNGGSNEDLQWPNREKIQYLKELIPGLKFENLGRGGQRFRMMIAEGCEMGSTAAAEPEESEQDLSAIETRQMKASEVTELSRLFYAVYGYNYINEYVYYPDTLHEMLAKGDLLSFVSVLPNGRIAAHIGVVRLNSNPPVYEIALGLTDPQIKSHGMFTRLFQKAIETAGAMPMSYCAFDFVTNHDFSQKLVHRYGCCDMALNVGSQISETQAKLEKLGIGKDSEDMDRYSILLSIKPYDQFPFGKEVALPIHLGEMCEFLLKPFSLHWVPAPRFYPLPHQGTFTKRLQQTQKAVYFDFAQPGFLALQKIVEDWQHLLRDGYLYAAVDMPLDTPGVGHTYDFLAKHGFFIAGFVPYKFSNRLGFRFQSIGPANVGFDDLRLASPVAKQLLQLVKQNYERNRLL